MIRLFITIALLGVSYSFMKGNKSALRYFEVGTKSKPTEWRDTSFVVATSNPRLISVIEAQLKMPIAKRNMITGKLWSFFIHKDLTRLFIVVYKRRNSKHKVR
jgi:hypothetical protein